MLKSKFQKSLSQTPCVLYGMVPSSFQCFFFLFQCFYEFHDSWLTLDLLPLLVKDVSSLVITRADRAHDTLFFYFLQCRCETNVEAHNKLADIWFSVSYYLIVVFVNLFFCQTVFRNVRMRRAQFMQNVLCDSLERA